MGVASTDKGESFSNMIHLSSLLGSGPEVDTWLRQNSTNPAPTMGQTLDSEASTFLYYPKSVQVKKRLDDKTSPSSHEANRLMVTGEVDRDNGNYDSLLNCTAVLSDMPHGHLPIDVLEERDVSRKTLPDGQEVVTLKSKPRSGLSGSEGDLVFRGWKAVRDLITSHDGKTRVYAAWTKRTVVNNNVEAMNENNPTPATSSAGARAATTSSSELRSPQGYSPSSTSSAHVVSPFQVLDGNQGPIRGIPPPLSQLSQLNGVSGHSQSRNLTSLNQKASVLSVPRPSGVTKRKGEGKGCVSMANTYRSGLDTSRMAWITLDKRQTSLPNETIAEHLRQYAIGSAGLAPEVSHHEEGGFAIFCVTGPSGTSAYMLSDCDPADFATVGSRITLAGRPAETAEDPLSGASAMCGLVRGSLIISDVSEKSDHEYQIALAQLPSRSIQADITPNPDDPSTSVINLSITPSSIAPAKKGPKNTIPQEPTRDEDIKYTFIGRPVSQTTNHKDFSVNTYEVMGC